MFISIFNGSCGRSVGLICRFLFHGAKHLDDAVKIWTFIVSKTDMNHILRHFWTLRSLVFAGLKRLWCTTARLAASTRSTGGRSVSTRRSDANSNPPLQVDTAVWAHRLSSLLHHRSISRLWLYVAAMTPGCGCSGGLRLGKAATCWTDVENVWKLIPTGCLLKQRLILICRLWTPTLNNIPDCR